MALAPPRYRPVYPYRHNFDLGEFILFQDCGSYGWFYKRDDSTFVRPVNRVRRYGWDEMLLEEIPREKADVSQ